VAYRFRNRVRAIRLAHGLTITELAQRAGVSRTTLHKIEADEFYLAKSPVMLALAEALGDPGLFVLEHNADPEEQTP
jgi:transcriptional regulator with XRE-family HTH domain